MSKDYLQQRGRLIEIESRILNESSVSNIERNERDQYCEVDDNDAYVDSYFNDFIQVQQG